MPCCIVPWLSVLATLPGDEVPPGQELRDEDGVQDGLVEAGQPHHQGGPEQQLQCSRLPLHLTALLPQKLNINTVTSMEPFGEKSHCLSTKILLPMKGFISRKFVNKNGFFFLFFNSEFIKSIPTWTICQTETD